MPRLRSCRPGPWGHVEYYDTYLEPPESLVQRLSLPSQQTVWHFVDKTREEICLLFASAQLTKDQLQTLVATDDWSFSSDYIRIFPPTDLVEALSPESRVVIYRVLAESELNPFHRNPIFFDRADLLQVLDRSGLPPEFIRHIAKLTYQEGPATLFSDFPVLLRHLKNPAQERQLLRILTRTRSLILRLDLDASDRIEDLHDYWTPEPGQTDSIPLMRSIRQTEGVRNLDAVHLLPPGPRSQLYTFPGLDDCLSGRAPDSGWTALNFFNRQEVPLYLDSPEFDEHLRLHYEPVSEPYRFGDMLLLAPQDTRRVSHACVYLADGIVYTKNGAQLMSPWILAHLADVVSYHIRGSTAELSGYRRRRAPDTA